MCKHEFWHSQMRPANFDPAVAIGERKSFYAESVEEARTIVAAMAAIIIGNVAHKPTLIEGLIPFAARA
jgi:hypothetical protein